MRPFLFLPLIALTVFLVLEARPVRASAFTLESTIAWNYGGVSPSGLTRGDFNGDGVDELAFVNSFASPLLVVYGKQEGEWKTLQAIQFGYVGASQVLLTWERPAPLRPALVLVELRGLTSRSTVRVLAGWPLRQVQSFEVSEGVKGAAIGDADDDGHAELVVVSAGSTAAYSLDTGQLKWSMVGGGVAVHVARFVPGQSPRVVVAGESDGRVYDGITRNLTWSYPDGFGRYLASGRFDSSGARQLVGAQDWNRLTVFNANPWSPVWEFARLDIDAVTTVDVDGDGIDEIIEADGQWGDVNVIDPVTRSIRYGIDLPGHGTAAVVAGELTGDGGPEIAVGPRTVFDDIILRIASGADGAVLHDLTTLLGSGVAFAVGDLMGDGVDRLVSCGRNVAIRNLQTGAVEWISPTSWDNNSPLTMSAYVVHLAQLDDDPALEVVLAGDEGYDGRVLVLDPVTRTAQLLIGAPVAGPFQSRNVTGAELFDFDGDGRQDLVVTTDASNTGSSGVRLEVYSLQTGALLWQSVTMGTGFDRSRGAMVVPAAFGDDAMLIAALPTGLRAYNARTRLLAWTLTADVRVARFLPNGLTGPEFALAGADGQLRFYDVATRTLQRTFPVGAVDEIHPIGVGTDLMVRVDGRLRVFSATGRDLAQSDPLGGYPVYGSSVIQFARGNDIGVIAGTLSGYIKFGYRPGHLFGDGFE